MTNEHREWNSELESRHEGQEWAKITKTKREQRQTKLTCTDTKTMHQTHTHSITKYSLTLSHGSAQANARILRMAQNPNKCTRKQKHTCKTSMVTHRQHMPARPTQRTSQRVTLFRSEEIATPQVTRATAQRCAWTAFKWTCALHTSRYPRTSFVHVHTTNSLFS